MTSEHVFEKPSVLHLMMVALLGVSSVSMALFSFHMASVDRKSSEFFQTQQSSRVTTTWPDGALSHTVQTSRKTGESVSEWGSQHMAEYSGLSKIISSKEN